MAAYGALVSVLHIIDQVQTHPHPPISIDEKQVESLTQVITSLQEFLEGYSSQEDFWESRIAEAAYDAEDVIESYIVDQIHVRSRNDEENISSIEFYQGLQKVIEDMNLIKIEIKEKMVVKDQPNIIKSVRTDAAGSSRSTSAAQNVTMVGFDDVLDKMLDKITGGGLARQIIPIVGMGGIGKTTLARNIYASPLVQQRFDVCAWSTVSQEYNAREILRQVLGQAGKGNMGDLSEDELGLHLHQYLIGRRYFIVMDDMWNIEAWDRVRRFFPDDKNGSRIVVTTRLSNLASHFNYSNGVDVKLLDEATSWNLFCKTVFGNESCPLGLEDIGMKIVKACKGLPLAIAVIGGLLSMSEGIKENWGSIEKHLSAIVNLDDNERCLQILYMSYNNLPVYIKPCFLYMGVYPEDAEIRIYWLIPVLVAEGFVKPVNEKSLEEAAEEYIKELVDRNLLVVEKRKHCGKIKSFKVHDLLRDVCLREARKLKFLCVLGEQGTPQGINYQRRIVSRLSENPTPLLESLESASLIRSFTWECQKISTYNFRLLRVSRFSRYCLEERSHDDYEKIFLELVNLRVLFVDVNQHPLPRLPSSASFLWNLQTLTLLIGDHDYVIDIWKMPKLRHVIYIGAGYCLPDPLSEEEDMVLENLQSLYVVSNLKLSEGVLKRIPNIKKLKLYYTDTRGEDTSRKDTSRGNTSREDTSGEDTSREDMSIEYTSREEDYYCLNNLRCLHKLETLRLWCSEQHSHLVSFPYSLKKLTLGETYLPWEDMATKIGWLPHLQVLKLKMNAFIGSKWETSEDQFLKLKFLLIEVCDLKYWITDSTHFPRLEHLVLYSLPLLSEIPLIIGDISTLQSIKVNYCSASAEDSAKRIKEEQEELGNQDLRIHLEMKNSSRKREKTRTKKKSAKK